jgi:hypothetical protein
MSPREPFARGKVAPAQIQFLRARVLDGPRHGNASRATLRRLDHAHLVGNRRARWSAGIRQDVGENRDRTVLLPDATDPCSRSMTLAAVMRMAVASRTNVPSRDAASTFQISANALQRQARAFVRPCSTCARSRGRLSRRARSAMSASVSARPPGTPRRLSTRRQRQDGEGFDRRARRLQRRFRSRNEPAGDAETADQRRHDGGRRPSSPWGRRGVRSWDARSPG